MSNANPSWRDFRRRLRVPIVLFSGLLVIVGAFQAFILKWTNDTLQAEQRAWLAPRGLEIPDNFRTGTVTATQIKVGIENVGKEPAIKTNEDLFASNLPLGDFRKQAVIEQLILHQMGNRTCKVISLNPNGRAIFPGAHVGDVVDLTEEQTGLALASPRTHFALVAGCLTYETLGKTLHRSLRRS